jgi:hypothetical protein
MADQKISQLNRLTGSQVDNDNDVLPIVDASADETKAISRAELMKNIPDATFSGSTSGIDYNDLDNLPPSAETPNDSTVTIVAGDGLTGGGSFTLNQDTPAEITLNATGGGGGTVSGIFDTMAALEADTETSYSVGTRLFVKSISRSYYVPSQTITDPHLTTAGGVKLYENGPQFSSPERMRQAVVNGLISEGASFGCFGKNYIKDASATGINSAFYDHGIDGVARPDWMTINYFMASLFRSQANERQYWYNSTDAFTWNRLNRQPQVRGKGDSFVGGRDSDLFWCEETGEIFRAVTTGTSIPQYDFSVWRSKDGLVWELARCYFGPTHFRPTLPDPNGDGSTQQLWGPKFFRDHASGNTYVTLNARTGPDYTNQLGGTSPTFRPYIARVNDLVNLTLDAPVAMSIGGATDAKLGTDIIRPGGTSGNYYALVKDSINRRNDVWSSSSLFGTWTLEDTLDFDETFESTEGPTWAPYIYSNSSSDVGVPSDLGIKYRVIVAHNRDLNDNLVGEQIWFESDLPQGPYSGPYFGGWPYAARNGGVKNVALEYSSDPRCMEVFKTMTTVMSGNSADNIEESDRLLDGSQTLYAQQNYLYYVHAARNATITVDEKLGEKFHLMVATSDPAAGITINGGSLIDAASYGPDDAFKVITYRWVEAEPNNPSDFTGRYITDYTGPASSGGGSGLSFENEGTPVDGGSETSTLNVVGEAVTVSGTGSEKTLTINGPDWSSLSTSFTLKTPDGVGQFTFTQSGEFYPTQGSGVLGTSTARWSQVWLEGQSVDGTNDGNNNFGLIVTNAGIVKLQEATTTGNNAGQDVASRVNINDLGSWSGTHVWDREEGSYLHTTLSAPSTIDLSSMKLGEVVGMTIRGLQNHGITFISGSGVTIRWIGKLGAASGVLNPAGTFWTNTEFSVIRIPNAIHIVAAEAQVP